jgi:HSP20 family protein
MKVSAQYFLETLKRERRCAMLATRWQPQTMWAEMNRIQNEMERLLGDSNGRRQLDAAVYPPLDLWEDDEKLYVETELPGFELAELEITVTGDSQLSIKGERKPPEVEGGTWHRQERGYGSFSRMIELPEFVDSTTVSAQLKHGVLTIMMPKKEESKPRQIEVKCQ